MWENVRKSGKYWNVQYIQKMPDNLELTQENQADQENLKEIENEKNAEKIQEMLGNLRNTRKSMKYL